MACVAFAMDDHLPSDTRRPAAGHHHLRCVATAILFMFAIISGLVGLIAARNHHAVPEVLAAPDGKLVPLTTVTWECGDSSAPVLRSADVVSYFTLQEGEAAVFGSKDYEVVYNGYLFRFVSAGNKALFEASPMDYMPAWGGFCAWGIARETWWDATNLGPEADPNFWLITDDNALYFFRTEVPKHLFMKQLSRNILAGDKIWSSWFGPDAAPGANATGSPLDTSCLCDVDGCRDSIQVVA